MVPAPQLFQYLIPSPMKFLSITVLVLMTAAAVAVRTRGEGNSQTTAEARARFPGKDVVGMAGAEPSLQPITAPSVNGVINPTLYEGRDLGEKINTALAGGNHCAEVHVPPGKYSYATTIRLTRACQSLYGAGSALTTLEYTGTGDAILWQMMPFTIQKAGTLKGFTLKGPGESSGNGIHSGSLVGATFEDVVINNFRGPHVAGILLENAKQPVGESGSETMRAWTERTVMRDVHIGIPHLGNSTALAFVYNGGTSSFGYTDIADVWMNVEKGQMGVTWGKGTYTYNSKLIFHANISSYGSNSFVVEGVIRTSLFFLTGEAGCAKDLVHVTQDGEVQGQGFVAVNCASPLTKGQYVRTDLAGVQVDNPRWDAFQLSPLYAPLVNGAGLLITHNLDHSGETDVTNYYGSSASAGTGGFAFYNTNASVNPPNADPKALLGKLSGHGDWVVNGSASWGRGAVITSSDQVVLKTQMPLTGRTSGIGGAVEAGNCLSGTANVPGAQVGQDVPHPNASDGSLDSPLEIVSGAVTVANTVTVRRCGIARANLAIKFYVVKVLP